MADINDAAAEGVAKAIADSGGKALSVQVDVANSAPTRILKRIEQPEDLVGTALYLLSNLSTFVTGQTILVNGGAVLH